MSEFKKCPYCAEEIKAEAIKCRYCKEFLTVEEAPTTSHTKATLVSGKMNQTFSDHITSDVENLAVLSGRCIHCQKDVTFEELSGKEVTRLLGRMALGNGVSGFFKSISAAVTSGNTGESRKCPACKNFIEICPNCMTINKLDVTNPIHACSACGENLS